MMGASNLKSRGLTLQMKRLCRRGSRINNDRFPKRAPKAGGVRGSPGNVLDFILPKVLFPGFLSHSDRILASSILFG